MDKFWQGHSLATLRGRKQGPVEFFYQHSSPIRPPRLTGTARVCYYQNIFKAQLLIRTQDTRNLGKPSGSILQFVILPSDDGVGRLYIE